MQCKSRRRHRVHRTVSSGAKQEGAAETKRQQKAEEGAPTPRTVSSRAEQAAGAAAPRTGASGDKWRPDATDGCIRDGTRRRRCRPPDWIIRGEAAAERQGLDHPGRIKQQGAAAPQTGSSGDKGRPDTPDWSIRGGQAAGANAPTTRKSTDTWRADVPDWKIRARTRRCGHKPRGGGKMVCRPGQDCPGRINQKGSPPPGLEPAGERGGQRRRKQEAETKVVQRRRQARKQRKGQRRGGR